MILLFGEQASKSTKSSKTNKNTNVRNNPVENAGILAMGLSEAKSMLSMGEYDTYISSNPVAVDYSMYSNSSFDTSADAGFMSGFSSALATINAGGGFVSAGSFGFSGGSFSAGGGFGGSCSSFSSVG